MFKIINIIFYKTSFSTEHESDVYRFQRMRFKIIDHIRRTLKDILTTCHWTV